MFEAYRMGKRAGYAGCKITACPFKNPIYRFYYELGYYQGLKVSLIEWLLGRK